MFYVCRLKSTDPRIDGLFNPNKKAVQSKIERLGKKRDDVHSIVTRPTLNIVMVDSSSVSMEKT